MKSASLPQIKFLLVCLNVTMAVTISSLFQFADVSGPEWMGTWTAQGSSLCQSLSESHPWHLYSFWRTLLIVIKVIILLFIYWLGWFFAFVLLSVFEGL